MCWWQFLTVQTVAGRQTCILVNIELHCLFASCMGDSIHAIAEKRLVQFWDCTIRL